MNLIKVLIISKKLLLVVTSILVSNFYYSQGNTVQVELPAIADTYISSENTSTNYGNSTVLYATRLPNKLDPSTFHTRRSLVKFDLSQIPNNAVITSASLQIYTPTLHYNPSTFDACRITDIWDESTCSWDSQITYTSYEKATSTITTTGFNSFDVQMTTQKMVAGAQPNNGWILKLNPETQLVSFGVNFYSREYSSDPNKRPKLIVDYYLPLEITSADIEHCNLSTSSDGSIAPFFIGGIGNETFEWYDASLTQIGSNQTLNNVPYGWYGLKVLNPYNSNVFYYSFIVGVKCEDVQINVNQTADFVDNPQLFTGTSCGGCDEMNYGNYATLYAYEGGSSQERRSLLRHRLWYPEDMQFNFATLTLHGKSHNNGLRSNDGQLNKVLSPWEENIVTNYSTPSWSTTDLIDLPATSVSNQDAVLDIKPMIDEWKLDNSSNYGLLMQLDDYVNVTAYQQYHSSNSTNSSLWPSLDLNVRAFCDRPHAVVSRDENSALYSPTLGHLYFSYFEEYDVNGEELKFKIYSEGNSLTPILHNGNYGTSLSRQYGDNRYDLDVSTLPIGTYFLEVLNQKEEKFYLQFIVE